MRCLVHTPRLFLPPALLLLCVIAIEVMDGSSSKLKDSITTLPKENSLNVSDAFACFRACQTSSAVVFGEIEYHHGSRRFSFPKSSALLLCFVQ